MKIESTTGVLYHTTKEINNLIKSFNKDKTPVNNINQHQKIVADEKHRKNILCPYEINIIV